MNAKARALGMTHTHYADPTGLSPDNVSTASDLAIARQRRRAVSADPRIQHDAAAITSKCSRPGKLLGFNNTNSLVKNAQWDIQLSKTGYIREAGKCLVMLATIASRPFVIVLLDSSRQVHAARRRAARPPLARDRRDAARRRAASRGAKPAKAKGHVAGRCGAQVAQSAAAERRKPGANARGASALP